ncbi:MAG: CHASE3 domain-containing protein [Desulfitobacteriaceae bacterium]
MKLATKLVSGFSVLLLLYAFTVAAIYFWVNDLSRTTESFNTYGVPMQTAAQDLALQFARQEAGIRGY